jgi:protein-S-isoprenylcysteine O-methyltransferase Ste14
LAQIALFGLVLLSPHFWSSATLWPGLAHWILGGILAAAGLSLFGAGLFALGSNLTPLPYPRDHSELRTDGVYRLVRHPIYGGLILLVAGYASFFPSVLEASLAAFTLVFFDRKASREEQWLRERYPTYEAYSKGSRKLFPWLY